MVGRAPEIVQAEVRRQTEEEVKCQEPVHESSPAEALEEASESHEDLLAAAEAALRKLESEDQDTEHAEVEEKVKEDSEKVVLLKQLPDEDLAKLCDIAQERKLFKHDRRWGRARRLQELAAIGMQPSDLDPPLPPPTEEEVT